MTIIGNLGRDPETKKSGSGNDFCTFSVGTQNRSEDKTEWFNVVAFGKVGVACSEYLKKGDKVFVEGTLRSNEWEDGEGIKRTSYSVTGYTVKFLSTKKESSDKTYLDGPREGESVSGFSKRIAKEMVEPTFLREDKLDKEIPF